MSWRSSDLQNWADRTTVSSNAALILSLMISTAFFYLLSEFGETSIYVMPSRHLIRIQRRHIFASKDEFHHFNSIRGVFSMWNSRNSPTIYSLFFRLTNGSAVYSGFQTTDEDYLISLAKRLSEEIGCIHNGPLPIKFLPVTAKRILISLIGSVLLYICWYRFHSGKICSAMWKGLPPIVIIGYSFASLLVLSRRFLTD